MRKIVLLALATALFLPAFSITVPTEVKPPKLRADQIMLPVGGKIISLLDLSRMNMKEVQELTGQKFKFGKKIAFTFGMNKLRQSINPDGTMDSKKLEKWMKKAKKNGDGEGGGFHAGGFFLGFFLGLIGVIIALVINDDKKQARIKWSLFGLLTWVVLCLLFLI